MFDLFKKKSNYDKYVKKKMVYGQGQRNLSVVHPPIESSIELPIEPPVKNPKEPELTEGQKRLNKRIKEKQNLIEKNRIVKENERKEYEARLKAKTDEFYNKLIKENTDALVDIFSDIKIRNCRDSVRAIAAISFSDGIIKYVSKSRFELSKADVCDKLSCSSDFTLHEQRLVAEKICNHIVDEYKIEASFASSKCNTTVFIYIFNR